MKFRRLFISKILILFTIAFNGNSAVTSFTFDEKTLQFSVAWQMDSSFIKKGFSAGLTVTTDKNSTEPPMFTFSVDSVVGDTIMTIDLKNRFDTLLYAALWITKDGIWKNLDTINQKSVFVSSAYRQPLSLFNSNQDTVNVLRSSVRIWKDTLYPDQISPHIDTIVSYTIAPEKLKGFIQISAPVRFSAPVPMPQVCIGVRYQNVPMGKSKNEIQIYRDSSGYLLAEKGAVNDTVRNIIYFRTTHLEQGFTLCIDTLKPRVICKSDTSKQVISADISDTVFVYDNSSNVDWKFYSGTAQNSFVSEKLSGIARDTMIRVVLPISVSGAREGGIHAVLYVTDGVNKDTIDLSRSVKRTTNMIVTNDNMVTPVYAISNLDKNTAAECLKALFSASGGYYNNTQFRIFRWLSSASNTMSANKWVEYSTANSANFQFLPGVLFWIHTAKQEFIDLGSGSTVSLRKPFAIKLQPKTWTDFGIPFNSKISLRSAFSSSSGTVPNISVYSWKKNDRRATYEPQMVYAGPSIKDTSLNDTLYPGAENCYTAFNPFDTAITLMLPAHPAVIDKFDFVSLAKRIDETSIIRISVSDNCGNRGMVYCGLSNRINETVLYPCPVAFSKPVLMLYDAQSQKTFGAMVVPENSRVSKANSIKCLLTNTMETANHFTVNIAEVYAGSVRDQKDFHIDVKENSTVELQIDSLFKKRFSCGTLNQNTGNKPSLVSFGKKGIVLEMSGVNRSNSYRLEIYSLDGRRCAEYSFYRKTNSDIHYLPIKSTISGLKLFRLIECSGNDLSGPVCTKLINVK